MDQAQHGYREHAQGGRFSAGALRSQEEREAGAAYASASGDTEHRAARAAAKSATGQAGCLIHERVPYGSGPTSVARAGGRSGAAYTAHGELQPRGEPPGGARRRRGLAAGSRV